MPTKKSNAITEYYNKIMKLSGSRGGASFLKAKRMVDLEAGQTGLYATPPKGRMKTREGKMGRVGKNL